MYKDGKSFRDVSAAFYEGRREGFGAFEREIGFIAERLSLVVDIDEINCRKLRRQIKVLEKSFTFFPILRF